MVRGYAGDRVRAWNVTGDLRDGLIHPGKGNARDARPAMRNRAKNVATRHTHFLFGTVIAFKDFRDFRGKGIAPPTHPICINNLWINLWISGLSNDGT